MRGLRIGLVYDLLGTHPVRPDDPPDVDAEFEPERTLHALEAAIRRLGHVPVRLGAPHALLAGGGKGELPPLDAALNIAEGSGSRNREAWAPVLLELLGVPALGSDALTLSLTLDKAWTKRMLVGAGFETPAWCALASAEAAGDARLPAPFPLFVKPRWEGTAKGIGPGSRVADRAALVREVGRVVRDYQQPALVEAFLPGAEYTVTVVGHAPPRVLPVLQRALEKQSRIGVHALAGAAEPSGGWLHEAPGSLEPALEAELARTSLAIFDLLACRDFARIDFKEDERGRLHCLEINPLPTFDPQASFGILAELEGRPVEALLADVIAAGLARLDLG